MLLFSTDGREDPHLSWAVNCLVIFSELCARSAHFSSLSLSAIPVPSISKRMVFGGLAELRIMSMLRDAFGDLL